MLALRRMWLRLVWGVAALLGSSEPAPADIIRQSGAVAVGHALVDVDHLLLRLIDQAKAARRSVAASAAPMHRIRQVLAEVVALVVAADGKPDLYARKKLGKALAKAHALLDAVAVFSVAAEPIEQRWHRIDYALATSASVTRTGYPSPTWRGSPPLPAHGSNQGSKQPSGPAPFIARCCGSPAPTLPFASPGSTASAATSSTSC